MFILLISLFFFNIYLTPLLSMNQKDTDERFYINTTNVIFDKAITSGSTIKLKDACGQTNLVYTANDQTRLLVYVENLNSHPQIDKSEEIFLSEEEPLDDLESDSSDEETYNAFYIPLLIFFSKLLGV